MKVLLINPPCRVPNALPLGLGYIASILKKGGNRVEILDVNGYSFNPKEVEDMIKKLDYDCVGIGGLSTTYKYVKWFANLVKHYRPEVSIIAGNMVATAHPELLLKNTGVDIAVVDEGELTCEELFSALSARNDLNNIGGIVYKKDGRIFHNAKRERIKTLDNLPFPAWELFPMEIYLRNPMNIDFGLKSINVSAVRGCPYSCNFCSRPFGNQVYARSADNIVEEIKELKGRYKIEYIAFASDHFIVSKDWITRLCEKILSEKLAIKWSASGRVNLVNLDILKMMKKSGCVFLSYGFESGCERILETMNKKANIRQAEEAIKLTRRAGIYAMGSFMIGMVGENEESIKDSLSFIKRTQLDVSRFFFATPYPNTPLYETAKKMGRIPDEEEKYIESLGEMHNTFLVNLTDFSDEELTCIKKLAEEQIKKNFKFRTHFRLLILDWKRRIGLLRFSLEYEGTLETIKKIINRLKLKLVKKKLEK